MPDFAKAGATLHHVSSGSERARRPHDRADPRVRLQARARVQPRDAAQLARVRAREDRHGAADVGESGFRRPIVHSVGAAQDCAGAADDRPQRACRSGSKWTAASRSTTSVRSRRAGADTFVAGSAIFGAKDYARDDQRDARADRRTALASRRRKPLNGSRLKRALPHEAAATCRATSERIRATIRRRLRPRPRRHRARRPPCCARRARGPSARRPQPSTSRRPCPSGADARRRRPSSCRAR